MRLFRALGTALLLLVPGLARAGLTPFAAPAVRYADAPVDLPLVTVPTDTDRLYVAIDDPNLGSRIFFLDTGFSVTTCDDGFARELHLRARRTLRFSRGELGVVPLRRIGLPAFRLGGHLIRNLGCAVRDLGTTSSLLDDPAAPVAGVLGANLLHRFRMVLDPSRGVLRLLRPGTGDALEGEGTGEARKENLFTHRRVVPVDLGDRPFRCVVDTGASRTYVDAHRAGLEGGRAVRSVTRASGRVNEAVRDQEVFEVQARLGGLDVGTVHVVQRSRSRFTAGLLGMDVLGGLALEVDPRADRFRVRRVSPVPLPTWPDWRRQGLEAALAAGDRSVVPALAALELATGHVERALDLASSVGDPSLDRSPDLARVRSLALEVLGRGPEQVALLRTLVQRFPDEPDLERNLGLRLLLVDPAAAVPHLSGAEAFLGRVLAGQPPASAPRSLCRDDPVLCALWREARGEDPAWDRLAGAGFPAVFLALDRGADPAMLAEAEADPVVRGILEEASGLPGVALPGCGTLSAWPDPVRAAFLAARCGVAERAVRWLDRSLPSPVDREATAWWCDAMAEVARALGDPTAAATYHRQALTALPGSAYLQARAAGRR